MGDTKEERRVMTNMKLTLRELIAVAQGVVRENPDMLDEKVMFVLSSDGTCASLGVMKMIEDVDAPEDERWTYSGRSIAIVPTMKEA